MDGGMDHLVSQFRIAEKRSLIGKDRSRKRNDQEREGVVIGYDVTPIRQELACRKIGEIDAMAGVVAYDVFDHEESENVK
jgi:hypothetical protein